MFNWDNLHIGDFEDPEVIDTSSFNNEIKFLGSGIINWKGEENSQVSNLLTRVGSSSLGVSNTTWTNILKNIESKRPEILSKLQWL